MRAVFLLFALLPQFALADGKYEEMVRLSGQRASVVRQEGVNYMVGGGLGLGLSVALGVRTKEALPKIGYSLIQVLSAAAIAHGASLYYQGDGLTQEGERLQIFARELEAKGVPGPQRKKILDSVTDELIRKEIARYRELRKIRGYLELTSAAASGVTLAFSKSKSSASSSALGFIILISLVGAYTDLLGPTDPSSMQELYSLDILPSPERVDVAWTYRF